MAKGTWLAHRAVSARKLDLIITYAEFAPRGPALKMKALNAARSLVSLDNPKVREGATVEDFKNEPFIKVWRAMTNSESLSRARRQPTSWALHRRNHHLAEYRIGLYGHGILLSVLVSRCSAWMTCTASFLKDIGKTRTTVLRHEDQENPAVAAFAGYLEQTHSNK